MQDMTALIVVRDLGKGLRAHFQGEFPQCSAHQHNPGQPSLLVIDRAGDVKDLSQVRIDQPGKFIALLVCLSGKDRLHDLQSGENRLPSTGKDVVFGVSPCSVMNRKDMISVNVEEFHCLMPGVCDDPQGQRAQRVGIIGSNGSRHTCRIGEQTLGFQQLGFEAYTELGRDLARFIKLFVEPFLYILHNQLRNDVSCCHRQDDR